MLRRIIRKDGVIQRYNVKKKNLARYVKTNFGLFSKVNAEKFEVVRKVKKNRVLLLEKKVGVVIDRGYLSKFKVDRCQKVVYEIPRREGIEFVFKIDKEIVLDLSYNKRIEDLFNKLREIYAKIKKLWLDNRFRFLEARYATIKANLGFYEIYMRSNLTTNISERGYNRTIKQLNSYVKSILEKLNEYPESTLYFNSIILVFETFISRIEKLRKEGKFYLDL